MTNSKHETRFLKTQDVQLRAALDPDSDGDIDLEADEDADGSVATKGNTAVGYAAVFNSSSEDLGGFIENIQPGAFSRSLKSAAAGNYRIFMLWSHDSAQPLGSTGAVESGVLKLQEDDHGLRFEMDTGRMTPQQVAALKDNDLKVSFGFRVRDQEWKELDDGSVERTLIDVDLFEISFVISPAYPDTEAALRSLEEWKAQRAAETAEEVRETEGDAEVEAAKPDTSALKKRAMEAMLRAKGRAS